MKFNKYTLIKLGLLVLCLIYIINQSRTGGDFRIYLGAADLLAHGKTCYNVWIETKPGFACGYSYSPFFATLLIPFTFIPEPLPQIFWLALNVFFLYRIWLVIIFFTEDYLFSKKQLFLWSFLTLLFSIRFILHNFEMVQMTIFLVYCSLEVVYLTEQKKNFKAGLILALGIVVKVMPVVMLPYLLFRKKFKAFGFSLLIFISFLIFPALFFGWEFNLQLLQDWMATLDPTQQSFITNQNINGEGIHSLSGLIAGYFTENDNSVDAPFSRTIFNLSNENISIALNSSRLFFIALTIFFLDFKPFKPAKNRYFMFWELSYIFAISPLIFPHQQKYAFFYLMPASAFVFHYLINRRDNFNKLKSKIIIFLMVCFLILATLTTDGLIGNYYNEITEYYKTITFGSFLLIIALFLCNPKKVNKVDNTANS